MPTEEKLDPEQRLRIALAASHKVDADAKAALVEELKARSEKPAEQKEEEKPVAAAQGTDIDDLAAAEQLKAEQKESEVKETPEAPAPTVTEEAAVVTEEAKTEEKPEDAKTTA
jgi:hypothetical protein